MSSTEFMCTYTDIYIVTEERINNLKQTLRTDGLVKTSLNLLQSRNKKLAQYYSRLTNQNEFREQEKKNLTPKRTGVINNARNAPRLFILINKILTVRFIRKIDRQNHRETANYLSNMYRPVLGRRYGDCPLGPLEYYVFFLQYFMKKKNHKLLKISINNMNSKNLIHFIKILNRAVYCLLVTYIDIE